MCGKRPPFLSSAHPGEVGDGMGGRDAVNWLCKDQAASPYRANFPGCAAQRQRATGALPVLDWLRCCAPVTRLRCCPAFPFSLVARPVPRLFLLLHSVTRHTTRTIAIHHLCVPLQRPQTTSCVGATKVHRLKLRVRQSAAPARESPRPCWEPPCIPTSRCAAENR